MTIRYLSLFSGIEAASVAWKPLGWVCVGVSEIERFPCDALAHHYPGVPNLGDVTAVTEHQVASLGRVDLIVFGSPCQDLSIAGKRQGLEGERSGLFFTAMRIVDWARKHCGLRWALWENVPGAFTSNEGRDFAVVVGALASMDAGVPPKGWGTEGCAIGDAGLVEWSTLDAQWFGVAQRRRRLFALADFGEWASRPPILLEPESLRGAPVPRGGAQEGAAATLNACLETSRSGDGPLRVLIPSHDVAPCLETTSYDYSRADGFTMVAYLPIAFNWQNGGGYGNANDGLAITIDGVGPLSCSQVPAVATQDLQVRKLTPRECERLQAFQRRCEPTEPGAWQDDAGRWWTADYTLVPQGKKLAADGPRYKALGNSMCVNVMRWIGQQIDFAHHQFASNEVLAEPADIQDAIEAGLWPEEEDLFA